MADLHVVNVSLNGTHTATAAGTIPFMYIPASHGAISITSAYLTSFTLNGTIGQLQIQKLTNAAVPLSVAAGTLYALPVASGTVAACGIRALTKTTSIVSPGTAGCFLGVDYVGTITAGWIMLTVNYVQGRDG